MTKKEEADYYMECAAEVAKWIGQLDDMRMRLEFISDQNNDNGDPEMGSHEALEALGKFLGSLICYYMETREEIENEQKEDENGKRHGKSSEALCSEVQDKER